jgi:hypothetical protein
MDHGPDSFGRLVDPGDGNRVLLLDSLSWLRVMEGGIGMFVHMLVGHSR